MPSRLKNGVLAGAAGVIVQEAYGRIFKAMSITVQSFDDVAKMFFMPWSNRVVASLGGLVTVGLLGIMLGVAFDRFFTNRAGKYYMVAGLSFGFYLWLILSGCGLLFRAAFFRQDFVGSLLAIWMGTTIYSLVTAYTLKVLHRN